MDTTYGRAVALAVPVFLFLIAVELFADRARGTRYYRLADSINSLSCGILSTGMRVFFGFLAIFTYEWVLNHWAPIRLPSNHWAVWVLAFVLYDLCYYWNHRLSHRMGIFWASHVVHHQSEEFNLTTALRQSGTGIVPRLDLLRADRHVRGAARRVSDRRRGAVVLPVLAPHAHDRAHGRARPLDPDAFEPPRAPRPE